MSHCICIVLTMLLVLGACSSTSPEMASLWDDFQEARKPQGVDDAHLAEFVAKCCVVADRLDDHDLKFTALLYAVDACRRGGTYAEARRLRADVMPRILPLVADDAKNSGLLLLYLRPVGRSPSADIVLEGTEFLGHIDELSAATASEPRKTDCIVEKISYLSSRIHDRVPLTDDERALALGLLSQLEARKAEPSGDWSDGVDAWIAASRTAFTKNRIGTEAVEIEGADLDGVAFKLSDYRGKVVMLDFWGYW